MQILLIAVFPAIACHFNHFHIHLPCMTHAPYFSPIRSNIYTKTFYVAVHLFSNISKMMSKCGKNKNKRVTHETQPSVTDILNPSTPMSDQD